MLCLEAERSAHHKSMQIAAGCSVLSDQMVIVHAIAQRVLCICAESVAEAGWRDRAWCVVQ